MWAKTNGKKKTQKHRHTHVQIFLLTILLWASRHIFEHLEKYETILWLPNLHFTVFSAVPSNISLFVTNSEVVVRNKQIRVIGSSDGFCSENDLIKQQTMTQQEKKPEEINDYEKVQFCDDKTDWFWWEVTVCYKKSPSHHFKTEFDWNPVQPNALLVNCPLLGQNLCTLRQRRSFIQSNYSESTTLFAHYNLCALFFQDIRRKN